MSKHAWNWKITTPNGQVTAAVATAADVGEALAAALGTPAGVAVSLAHGIGREDLVEMPGASDVRQLFTGKGCEILLERAVAGGTASPSLWHYTAGHKLQMIRESWALHPNGAKVAPNERPVVWFSADAVYEPTAIKLLHMPGQARLRRPTVAELHELVGVFRFAIKQDDPRLAAWPAVHRKARISAAGVANMIRAGVEIGAKPMNWFGAFEEIALSDLRFEAWTGQQWVAAQIDASIEQIRAKMELVHSISAAAYGPAGIRQAWQAGASVK
jgi:hypothetical protein